MDNKGKFTFKEPSTDPKYLSLYKRPTPRIWIVPEISGISHDSIAGPQSSKGQERRASMEGSGRLKGNGGQSLVQSSTSLAGPSTFPIEADSKTISKQNGHLRTEVVPGTSGMSRTGMPSSASAEGRRSKDQKRRPSLNLIVQGLQNSHKAGEKTSEQEVISSVDLPALSEEPSVSKTLEGNEHFRTDETPNNNSSNFEQPLSDLLTNLINHRALQTGVDQNEISPSEIIENSALFFQMLGKMADVFIGMPNNILEQLSGYDNSKHIKITLMTTKFKSLLNKNFDVSDTPEQNNTENDQSTNEVMNYNANDISNNDISNNDISNKTDDIRKNIYNDLGQQSLASTSKSFLINNDDKVVKSQQRDSNNDISNNDISNKTDDIRKNIYNDLGQQSLASTSKSFLINNDDKVVKSQQRDSNNDISNKTDDIRKNIYNDLGQQSLASTSKSFLINNDDKVVKSQERDSNNDPAANCLSIKKEICDDLNEECVPRNVNYSIQDGELIVISDNDIHSDSTETLNELNDDQPDNICDNNDDVEAKASIDNDNLYENLSDRTRSSPPLPFDDNDKEEWFQLASQLDGLADLYESDTDFTEEVNVDNVQNDNNVLNALRTIFRFENFKEGQEEVIRGVVEYGYDYLVIMPTGGGKSLCYELPAVLTNGVTVVVCPYLSSIQDQIRKLEPLNIKVEHISGTTKTSELVRIEADLKSNEPTTKLLYVTAEKLEKNDNLNLILKSLYERGMISRFVIDEAHYISQSEHDFRTAAYKKLGQLRVSFLRVPLTALSACAGPATCDRIVHELQMQDCKVYRMSLDRPSLSYNVVKKTDTSFQDVAEMIRTDYMGQSCIIYCPSVDDTKKMAKILNDIKVTAVAYYGGINDKSRMVAHSDWQSGVSSVMCATNAFGQGIDKAGVPLVVHLGVPGSLSQYSLEAGRAGRGVRARCVLYFRLQDVNRGQNYRGPQSRNSTIENNEQLSQMVAYCQDETKCRRLQILEYFEDLHQVECGETRALCDNCVRRRGQD